MNTFKDTQEKIDFLKKYKLMPKTFTEIPTLYYFKVGSDIPDICDVVGYDAIYDNWATITIKVNNDYINIHSDYLLEMKTRGKSYFNNLANNNSENSYVVFDLETTGLSNKTDKIIEIAALKVTPTGISEFNKLVYTDDIIPINISLLTGITNDMLSDADPIEVVLPEFLKFIGNCDLVGHNIKSFDIHFIYNACEKLHLTSPTNNLIDMLHLAKKELPDLDNYKLSTLCQYYDIDTTNAHRALKDCYMCNECYKHLINPNEEYLLNDISFSDLEIDSLWYKIVSLLNKIIINLELPDKGLILKENLGTKIVTRSICINEPPYPAPENNSEKLYRIQSISKIEETINTINLTITESSMRHCSVPDNVKYKIIKGKNNKPTFVVFYFPKDDTRFFQLLEDTILYRLKTYISSATTFGCCSQYIACSDAKKCLHENKLYSTACQYRRNLENNKIFYGKNRNVD